MTIKNKDSPKADPTNLQNLQIDKSYQSVKDGQISQNMNFSRTRPQTVSLVRQSKDTKNENQEIQSSQIIIPSPIEQYDINLNQQNLQKNEFQFQRKKNQLEQKNTNQYYLDPKSRYQVNNQQQFGLINNSFAGFNSLLAHKGADVVHENQFTVSRNKKQQEQEIQVSAEMGQQSFTLEGESVPLQNTQEKPFSQDFQNTHQSFLLSNSKINEDRVQADQPSILALSNRIDKAIQESFIEDEGYGSPQGQKQIKGVNLKQRYQDHHTQIISLQNSMVPIGDTLQNFSKNYNEYQVSKMYKKKQFKSTKRPQSQMRTQYNNSIRINPMQNQVGNKTIDLEFLKFYEAFKNQENSSKPPIKPSGVSFKDDIDKLKKVTNEIQQTMNKVDQQHMERDALSKLFKIQLASNVVSQMQIQDDSDAHKFVSMTEILTQKINSPLCQQTQAMNNDSSDELLQVSNMIPQTNSLFNQNQNTFDQSKLEEKLETGDDENQFYSQQKFKVVQKDANFSQRQLNVNSEQSVKTEEFQKKIIQENQQLKIENEQTLLIEQHQKDLHQKKLTMITSIITGSQLPKSESLIRIASASYKQGNWKGVPQRKTSTKLAHVRNSRSVNHERTQYYRQPKISQLDFEQNSKQTTEQILSQDQPMPELFIKKQENSKQSELNQSSFISNKNLPIERPLLDTKNAYNNAINFILSAKDSQNNTQQSNEISKKIFTKIQIISPEKLSPNKTINEVDINNQKQILRALDMELQQKLQAELVASDGQFINFKSEPLKQTMKNVVSSKIDAISGGGSGSIGKQFFTRLKNQKSSLARLEQIKQRKFEDELRDNLIQSNQMVKMQVFVKQNTFGRKKTIQPQQTYKSNINVFKGLFNNLMSKKELTQKKKTQHEILCHIEVPKNKNNLKNIALQTNQSNISPKSKGIFSQDQSPFFIKDHQSNNLEKSQANTDQISGISLLPSAKSQVNKNRKHERNSILFGQNSFQNQNDTQVKSVVVPNTGQSQKEADTMKTSEVEKRYGISVKSLTNFQIEKLNNIILRTNSLKNRFSQKSMKEASLLETAFLTINQLEKPESEQILTQLQSSNLRNQDYENQEFKDDQTVKKISGQNSSTELINNLIYEQKTEISRQKVYSSQYKKDQKPIVDSQQQQSFKNLTQAESQMSLLAPVLQQNQSTESKNNKSSKQIFLQSFENDLQPYVGVQLEISVKSPLSDIIGSTISNKNYPLVSVAQNYLMGISSPRKEYETEPIPEIVQTKKMVIEKKRQESQKIKQNLKNLQNKKNKLGQESGMKIQNMNFSYQIQKTCSKTIYESNEHKILSEVSTSGPKGDLLQKISNQIMSKKRKSEGNYHQLKQIDGPKQPSDSERKHLHSLISKADRPGQLKKLFICPRQPNLKDFTIYQNKEQKIRSKTTTNSQQDSEVDAYYNWIIYNKALKQETYNSNKIVYFPENHNNLNRNIAIREREKINEEERQNRQRDEELFLQSVGFKSWDEYWKVNEN